MTPASEPRWLTEPEQDAWYAWRRMFPLVNAEIARDLGQDSGLSEADYDVLSVLGSTDGHRMRISALAGLMHWSRSRLSHQLTRMEQRGIVRREEVAGDGRGAEVVLTETGVDTIMTAAPLHVESVRRHLIDVLTPQQLRTLAEVGEVLRLRMGAERKRG
ncbi:winged helix-turn-helix transcriptional regulator [Streptomyces sp. ISL-44]|uniref:MarR family winged helix-turn-helix transcriptional regulator n=1 Tax=unclassified Streptomyces TaxID=2593676 RepID=UPI001BE55AC4|nr:MULTISPECIES: MarR family winged helix-turn-helix transcriptional regulator [unclassified Streptomyces]MBT2544457.1 winged helix-turn-helix transcriptional regulator [Streptomyces sp. ISL-44]MCX5607803.1 MarR family winged helix-turn-helix transcriptional regulator [Streptomyces sp. NBC_00047]UUU41886.1 MarR family winged helix-turn-helix transcriptional regulator [Streptomyces sp. NBC_00162]